MTILTTAALNCRNLWHLSSLFLLLGASAIARSKVDVITFKNGDHWTCEIKSLAKG